MQQRTEHKIATRSRFDVDTIEVKGLVFKFNYPLVCAVSTGEVVARMSTKHIHVLYVLYHANGQFITVNELIDSVWGGYSTPSSVIVAISYLRKLIGPECIRTVTGAGYALQL